MPKPPHKQKKKKKSATEYAAKQVGKQADKAVESAGVVVKKAKKTKMPSLLKKFNKQLNARVNSLPSPVKSALLRLTKLTKYLWVWIIAGLLLLVIYFFSAQTAETFSNKSMFLITFDHEPAIADVKAEVEEFKLSPEDVEVANGNQLQFRSPAGGVTRKEFYKKITEREDVLAADVYRMIPAANFDNNISSATGPLLILSMMALAVIGYLYRNNLLRGLKLWALFNILPVLAGLFLADLGIVISKLGVITLNKSTFDLFMALIFGLLILNVYMFSRSDIREKLLKIL